MGVPISTLNVYVKLDKLKCFDSAENGITTWPQLTNTSDAEPYLWPIFYKLDGSTLTFNSRTGKLESPTPDPVQPAGPDPDLVPDIDGHVGKPRKKPVENEHLPKNPPGPPYANVGAPGGRHRNLKLPQNSIIKDQTVSIPTEIGEWNTQLKPIPIVPPVGEFKAALGAIGIIVVLMEQDNSLQTAVDKGYTKLYNEVQGRIADQLAAVRFDLNSKNINEVKETISADDAANKGFNAIGADMNWLERVAARFDLDDLVAVQHWRYSHVELVLKGGKRTDLVKRWDTPSHGSWQITGWVDAWDEKDTGKTIGRTIGGLVGSTG